MKIMRPIFFTIFVSLVFALPAWGQMNVSQTKYDWSGLANSVTSTTKAPKERAYDIYKWIVQNIAYDTSHSIYTADETYENQKGVCQGYCELFYRIAEVVGLRCDIISGQTKNHDGIISTSGHAWLFVYTNENTGFLVDPTWGAGTVDNGHFERAMTDMWFQTDPEWMIFSHLPDDQVYQLIDNKISYEQFASIPRYDEELSFFGYTGSELMKKALSGSPADLPTFYTDEINKYLSQIKVPTQKRLRVGEQYDFIVRGKESEQYAIINNNDFDFDWDNDGKISSISFIPHIEGRLCLSVKQPNGKYMPLIEYVVDEPNASDIAKLEKYKPLMSPTLRSLNNYNAGIFKTLKVDFNKLISMVKAQGIKALPKIYSGATKCRLTNIPWDFNLKVGKNYTFTIHPEQPTELVIVENGEQWHKECVQEADGGCTIKITPTHRGKVQVFGRELGSTSKYWGMLEYEAK